MTQPPAKAAESPLMPSVVVLAAVSVGCFFGLAHAAVTTPRVPFRRMTVAMALIAFAIGLASPAAGAALLAPVLFSRKLSARPIPSTVDELLNRSRHS
jgi:ABC-type transport system involved in cytochrome c biogenesis permease subunit